MSVTLASLKRPPSGLFWSAPLELDSDFTAEDPLAFDYLGQQVGNWLFSGFTTRTSRAQYYAVVLYGLHLADLAIREYGYHGDDKTRTQLFERWERFWALATLESRGGQLERGDDDAMRGVRGATRNWVSGSKPLALDFPLISRQSELGGLGAYLTSLREYKLVFPGTMRTTPVASGILNSFWSEPGKRKFNDYEKYALKALDFRDAKIGRDYGRLTLSGVGNASRLSSIKGRVPQQERIWHVLFVSSRDGSTLPLAQQLIQADEDHVVNAEELLEGMLAGRWGKLGSAVLGKVESALAFARLAQFLLRCFDRIYGHVDNHGWVSDVSSAAKEAFPDSVLVDLRKLCGDVHKAKDSRRFGQLQFHGPAFLNLVTKLSHSSQSESLQHVLSYHRIVQKTRRGSGAWIRQEQDKLVMQTAGYNGYKSDPRFPGMKLGVVRTLLNDLGKIK